MICINDALDTSWRTAKYSDLINSRKYDHIIEDERNRFYIVTTLKCPCKCKFCLFVLTANEIQDCSNEEFAHKVKKILHTFPEINFSISITGGEPFIFKKRIIAILDAIKENTTPDKVRWIGFGTSGVTAIPTYLNNYPEFRFDLYLSRHHYNIEQQQKSFGYQTIHGISEYMELLDSHINIRVTCNLIQGEIDNSKQIKKYLQWAQSNGIKKVTFRELNKIANDASMYKQQYIVDYIKYYENNIITLSKILQEIEHDDSFTFISQDRRPFIYHEHWQYNNIAITFRRVDEAELLEHNDNFDEIDEIVLHSDGLVTGCWDRNQKILKI